MPSLAQGDRISNYLLDVPLGRGRFGEVWRAKHHVFDEVVAIKVPTDKAYVRNLQREGIVVHGLRHPNIVRAIDLDPYEDPPYLVMEYIDGPSLREAIDHAGSVFPLGAALAVIRGVLHALHAAHQHGVIHRDIKPANILIGRPLEDLAGVTVQDVKVTDFGLGRVGGDTARSIMQSGSAEDNRALAGTLAYMAPEQRDGNRADARSDLYACGIVLFEMLTGKRPAGNDLPSSLRSEVPTCLDRVFERSYTRWERRFASAQDMLAALAPSEAGSDGQGMPPPPTTPGGAATVCPACRQPVLSDDCFCIRCGQQLSTSVPRCQSCQAFVDAADRFCIHCGNDLQVLSE